MPNILDTTPNAQAYMFTYRFQVGNSLRIARTSQLRIEAERQFEEVRLFLDPAGLVEGIRQPTESLNTNVPLGASLFASNDVQVLPLVEWRASGPPSRVDSSSSLTGLKITIPAGTDLGLSPSPAEGSREEFSIRFPKETEIEVGVKTPSSLREYDLRRLKPVLLDGIPILEISGTPRASVRLQLNSTTAILKLVGIVSPYRHRGEDALYHVMEAIGDRVVGGASLQIRL